MKIKTQKIIIALIIVTVPTVLTGKILMPFAYTLHTVHLVNNRANSEDILAVVNKGMVLNETQQLKTRLACLKPACFSSDLTVYDSYDNKMIWNKDNPYEGEWNNGVESYDKGFTALLINDVTDDTVNFSYICVSPENENYISILYSHPAELKDNVATAHFDEDGWGSSGTIKMTFSEDMVNVTIDFDQGNLFSKWEIQESELKFYYNKHN